MSIDKTALKNEILQAVEDTVGAAAEWRWKSYYENNAQLVKMLDELLALVPDEPKEAE